MTSILKFLFPWRHWHEWSMVKTFQFASRVRIIGLQCGCGARTLKYYDKWYLGDTMQNAIGWLDEEEK